MTYTLKVNGTIFRKYSSFSDGLRDLDKEIKTNPDRDLFLTDGEQIVLCHLANKPAVRNSNEEPSDSSIPIIDNTPIIIVD